MKLKQVKHRTALGTAQYEDMTDLDGLIEIARAAEQTGMGNARTSALVEWADGLGRAPTVAEFEAFAGRVLGAQFVRMDGIEGHEN